MPRKPYTQLHDAALKKKTITLRSRAPKLPGVLEKSAWNTILDRLKTILRTALKLSKTDDEIHVYFWSGGIYGQERTGIDMRIAEISVSTKIPGGGVGGFSWMQSEADASALIFRCERFLLVCVDVGCSGDDQEEEEAIEERILRDYIKTDIMDKPKTKR